MKKRDYGHLKSQKFAALIFCVFVLCVAAMVLAAEIFSTLVMGVVALYGAFAGARTISDNAALKFGAPAQDNKPAVLPAHPAVVTAVVKKEKQDVD